MKFYLLLLPSGICTATIWRQNFFRSIFYFQPEKWIRQCTKSKQGRQVRKRLPCFPTGSSICLFFQGSTLPFCAFSLQELTVWQEFNLPIFFRLETPVSSSGNTRCSFCIFTATGQRKKKTSRHNTMSS